MIKKHSILLVLGVLVFFCSCQNTEDELNQELEEEPAIKIN